VDVIPKIGKVGEKFIYKVFNTEFFKKKRLLKNVTKVVTSGT
jgi:hypothetical protein